MFRTPPIVQFDNKNFICMTYHVQKLTTLMSENANWFIKDCHIKWSKLDVKTLKPEILAAIEESKTSLAKISTLKPEEITFDSVFTSFDYATIKIHRIWSFVSMIKKVHKFPGLNEIYDELASIVNDFSSSIYMDHNLYSVIKLASTKLTDLDPVQHRLVNEIVRDFVDQGCNLNTEDKDHLTQLKKEILIETNKYSKLLVDSINSFEYYEKDESELKGIPDFIIAGARQNAINKGHPNEWLFNLFPSCLFPILKYAESESLRQKLWEGYIKTCTDSYDNEPIIWNIIRNRNSQATLLGYENYGEFILSHQTAQNFSTADSFVSSLHDKVHPKFLSDFEELKHFVSEQTGQTVTEILPYNINFYTNKMLQSLYNFNEEDLRPYFKLEQTLEGLFTIIHRVYGINFVERQTYFLPSADAEPPSDAAEKIEVWNPDVKFFDVFDSKTHELIGQFFADFFPNDEKQPGSMMCPLINGNHLRHETHLGLISLDLTKPAGDKPSLLTHDEVLTLFHEMGHTIHLMLSKVEFQRMVILTLPRDFLEMPSMLMEKWAWEKEAIDLFAKHWKTGEKIPNDLWNKKKSAKNFRSASFLMGQLRYGHLDLTLHHDFEKYQKIGLDNASEQITKDYRIITRIKIPSEARQFPHLFNEPQQYACCYYGYMWSDVMVTDIFSRFKKEGIFNENLGEELKNKILSLGNSKEPIQMFRDFMGKDPDQNALLISYGIIDE